MALRLRHQPGGASGRGEAVSKFSGRGSWEPTGAPGSPGSPLPVPPPRVPGRARPGLGLGTLTGLGPSCFLARRQLGHRQLRACHSHRLPWGAGRSLFTSVPPSPCGHPAWHFSFWEELPVWSLLQGMPPSPPPAFMSSVPPVARAGPGVGTVLATTLGRGKDERVCPPDAPLRPALLTLLASLTGTSPCGCCFLVLAGGPWMQQEAARTAVQATHWGTNSGSAVAGGCQVPARSRGIGAVGVGAKEEGHTSEDR